MRRDFNFLFRNTIDDFYPGYARTMSEIGKERGWRKMTRESFDAQRGPQGALLVGAEEAIGNIIAGQQATNNITYHN